MKIKPFKILGTVLKAVAVPVGGLVGGIPGAAVAAAGLGSGKVAKEVTKAVQQKTGTTIQAQNAISPIAAIAVTALLSKYIAPEMIAKACEAASRFCENPDIGSLVLGVVLWLSHQLGSNVQNVAPDR